MDNTTKYPPAAYKMAQELGREFGISAEEIQRTQQQASDEGAPLDAVLKSNKDGTWITAQMICDSLSQWLQGRQKR